MFATVDVQARVGARNSNAAHVSSPGSTRSEPKVRRANHSRHLAGATKSDKGIADEFKVSENHTYFCPSKHTELNSLFATQKKQVYKPLTREELKENLLGEVTVVKKGGKKKDGKKKGD